MNLCYRIKRLSLRINEVLRKLNIQFLFAYIKWRISPYPYSLKSLSVADKLNKTVGKPREHDE